MKISQSEKLILLMLGEIYDKLELDNIDTNLLRSVIYTDNTWALDWEMPGIVGRDTEPTPPLVINVVNYLDMWSFLEESYNGLDSEAKDYVANKAGPYGKHVRFPGFDGNNEGDALSIASLLIYDMARFSRFKGRDLNSHAPLMQNYERMYATFSSIRPTLSLGNRFLDAEQIVSILNAMRNSGY